MYDPQVDMVKLVALVIIFGCLKLFLGNHGEEL